METCQEKMKIVIYQALILHTIVMLNGVHTVTGYTTENITGLLGENGTQMECSYTINNLLRINSVSLHAMNYSTATFDTIVTYIPDIKSLINPLGLYLKGRVTLSYITQSSTKAVIIFNKLLCIDDTFYRCEVRFIDFNGVPQNVFTNNISISVQVPPLKPDSISLEHMPAVSSVTTTDNMDYSYQLPAVTQKKHETVAALQSVTLNNTTTLNHSTLPTTDSYAKSSIPVNDEFSFNIRYKTSTYSTQQTTTEKGIVKGDIITVICRGDVGKPPGEYVFEKYLNGHIIPIQDTVIVTLISELSDNCSYYRTSNLTFKVTAEDNNAVIRCVVNSSMADQDMYVETEPLEVYSDKTTPSTSGSWLNKAKDNGTVIAIAIVVVVVVLIVIGVVVVLLYRRIKIKEEYKPVDRTESNIDKIESQEITQTVPSTSSTKKTTGYEDVDLDDTDMKFKLSDEGTIDQVKQHNEEYLKKLKEEEDREKDNRTEPPEAAVYACVNKPKNKTTTENKPPVGKHEEDVYKESKEGLYDTSGDRRHKENITVENYNSTENLKNEESDHNDLFSEQNSQIGAYINKTYGSSENKDEKRQVATVSPTVRLSSSLQDDEQKHKSDEIQPKTEKPTTHETSL